MLDEILKENENNNEANPDMKDMEEIKNFKGPGINCCSKYWLDGSR